jgi:hypothetical protein
MHLKIIPMEQTKFHNISKVTMLAMFLLFFARSLTGQTELLTNLPQYLFPHFDTSIVKLKTGELSKALMNYNTLTEKMAFYEKGTLSDLIKSEIVDTVCIKNRLFVPCENAFYEVILNASISFFIQHKSDLVSEGRPGALGTTTQTGGVTSVSKFADKNNSYNLKLPENFKVKPYKVYWVRINKEMHKFLNERQFLKIFPANETEIKDFMNQSHIKIDNTEDLVKLANFCNELIG